MSKALSNPTIFAATGILFAAATFFNLSYTPSDSTTATSIVSPAHASPYRLAAPIEAEAPAATVASSKL